ncbi:MAG: hypothetical protein OEZ57_00235 [Nitrospirota bacterium]|nr:hypothetical protein [Nitrospirota bacterium]MDH5586044.1 hypothetical protein [Nitrospirota bacterium]MDH5773327.1 hypothetical protein [Nitrospirota bacterium]
MDIDASKRQEAIDLATSIIKGTLHPLEGCHRLARIAHSIGLDADKSIQQILATSSEMDHLPFGSLKEQCSVSYLERIEREEREYLESALDDIVRDCKAIIEKLSTQEG